MQEDVLKEEFFLKEEFCDFREGCPVCADSSMEMENPLPKMLSNQYYGWIYAYVFTIVCVSRYIFTTWERIDEALQILSSVNSSC